MTCPICKSENRDHSKPAFESGGYLIIRCQAFCSFYVDPPPTPEAIEPFYENYYKTTQYTAKLDSKIRRAKRRIRSLSRKNRGSFLDVGCNVGFAVEAARRLGYQAFGIDLDSQGIDTAKRLFPECQFACEDLLHLAESRRQFDVVYCSEVIEHLDLRNITREDGLLYLTTPDVGHFSLPRRLEKLQQWSNFRPPEHLRYFTKRGLDSLLKRSGFRSVRFLLGFKPTIRLLASRS